MTRRTRATGQRFHFYFYEDLTSCGLRLSAITKQSFSSIRKHTKESNDNFDKEEFKFLILKK